MNSAWRAILWNQFGASIDMLENAINACPKEVWGDKPGFYEFWYYAYHTLFFLDLYLSESEEGFAPPKPFTLSELDDSGVLPDRVYSREELLTYLDHGRRKCRKVIEALTDEDITRKCAFGRDLSVVELMMYNMRHVQHHAAQLNLLLRQKIDSAPLWISKAGVKPRQR